MSILLEIDGEYLKSKYSVYIIEIVNGNRKYYYIGQTGDAHYVTARSPFRRLVGHLSDLKSSTENQVYKYFASLLLNNDENNLSSYSSCDKEKIEKFFVESKIKMYSFPIIDFSYRETLENHKSKRKKVLEFEKQIIVRFHESSKNLINKKIPKKVNPQIEFVSTFNEIIEKFELQPAHNNT
jgi:hypothetical protein